jgi:aminopeptidase N
MWLNEGFAEFMPGQYWQVKKGRHLEDDYYLDEYGQFMQIDEDRRMPLAALGSNNIYPKGALVLRMLQRVPGKSALLGLGQALPRATRLRQRDDRRLPPGGARRDW